LYVMHCGVIMECDVLMSERRSIELQHAVIELNRRKLIIDHTHRLFPDILIWKITVFLLKLINLNQVNQLFVIRIAITVVRCFPENIESKPKGCRRVVEAGRLRIAAVWRTLLWLM